jgi:hypothetical protein
MQASVGGGISGAAARAAGPESLSPRERPENVRIERVLRASDGLGFCRSSLAGRRLNPTPELSFQYKERDRERERERDSKLYPSTDASCFTDTCPETVFVDTAPKLGKGGKKKKSGAARRRRKKERIDASLALFEAEAAECARLGALAVVARVLHKVRNLSKSVIKWNVRFSNELARWASQNAAVAAVWAAERAEDEAEWAADEAILTLKIWEMVSKGLTRRKRGRRGVGSGRRRNRRAGKERQRQRQEQTRQARAAEGWRQAEVNFVQQQELQWLGKGGMGSNERRVRWKQRRMRVWARGTTIWQRRPKGQAGEHEGSAPAECRRQVRAAGARWGRRPRYWRLGGGGKTGWVT